MQQRATDSCSSSSQLAIAAANGQAQQTHRVNVPGPCMQVACARVQGSMCAQRVGCCRGETVGWVLG
jgi:hypothetical protein